jgi:histidyl-tRNA synthetase
MKTYKLLLTFERSVRSSRFTATATATATSKARRVVSTSSISAPRNFTTIPLKRQTQEDINMAPKEKKLQMKVVKGMKDCDGPDIVLRQKMFDTITGVFKLFGAVQLDTPVVELTEILAGKYGEDSKLIYNLADQGGEEASLRYDLTVPFARYLAMNPSITTMTRWQLGKVYRRDQPAMTKGRLREFYQLDIDIAGQFDPMIADAECLSIANRVFKALGWDNFTIKLNNRKVLDGIFEVCGVPTDKLRPISSAVDKLDKLPWAEVRREMVEEKGLAEDVADKIGGYVLQKGQVDLLDKLKADETLMGNTRMKEGVKDMELLFEYLTAYGALDKISFDLSLARGLDYYTGVIFEVVTEGSAGLIPVAGSRTSSKKSAKTGVTEDEDRSSDPSVGVGSVAAGGRYDNLVGMFSKKQIPCVGISFGIERILAITKMKLAADKNSHPLRRTEIDVMVMAFGGKGFEGLLKERIEINSMLIDAQIRVKTILHNFLVIPF